MPLNKLGNKIKRNFEKEYGKKKGDEYFYRSEHKGKFNKLKIKK